MTFNVRFKFIDEKDGDTARTYVHTGTLIASVLTDVTTLAALFDAVTLGGLESVNISQVSTAEASAAEANSNIDANASVQVMGGDGYKYDFDLPMPDPSVILADRRVDTTNAGIIALFAAFGSGDVWRINLRNPTPIASVIGGTLDK